MPEYAFFGGEVVPIERAKVSIMTHALNYGTGCFEGIRAYWSEDAAQLYLFRPREHFERMLRSARILMIEIPYTADELCQITIDLLRAEDYQCDVYIRPLAYKADEIIGVRLHGLRDALAMFALPFGSYVHNEQSLRVCISSWRRMDDNIAPPRAKITGAYINSALIKTDAVLSGFDEALVLTQSGHVSEGSAENFFLLRDGHLITPPTTSDILEGITRSTLMELAREELGLATLERDIDRSEVYIADEAFFCGTGCQIAAIVEVDHRPIGDGRMGPIVQRLRELYFAVVRAEVEKYMGWCVPVYPND